jgi:hypothetical protein
MPNGNNGPDKYPLTPCRGWASPSYDANTGMAASSLDNASTTGRTVEGERITPSRQMPKGRTRGDAPSFKELDAMRTQGGTPVSRRPIG